MYARTTVDLVQGPIDAAAIARLKTRADAAPQSLIVVQLPGRAGPALPGLARYFVSRHGNSAPSPDGDSQLPWLRAARLRLAHMYSVPNGRRYGLLELDPGP
jgi:hypothetical protein